MESYSLVRVFLILNTILLYTNNCSASRPITSESTQFIRTSCSSTTYPTLCFDSLSTHASLIQTSHKLLVDAALKVTLSAAKSTSSMMVQLSKSHGLNPQEVGPMVDCVEELSDTVEELRKSIGEMGKLINSRSFDLMINNIETWVSAAMTDETTCTDGFQGMDSKVTSAVRQKILNVGHLTSNALSLINQYATLHGN